MDNYWLRRLKADRALADRAAAEVSGEVRRAYRSQYLQVARRLDELYAEAQRRGTLSRTKLWNYRAYRDLEAELSQYCEAGSLLQIDRITEVCDRVFREVIGGSVEDFRRERFILPYSPRAVIDTAWSGESFSTRIWKNTGQLAERIRQEAQQVVMGLRSTTAIKQSLMKDFDVSWKQADRLVDTEVSYVLNKANLEAYRSRGRRKLTIMNLDVNTCEKCKALEGEVFWLEDVPVIPIHPRCHCAYCVPDGGDGAEVTASGSDLEALYERKGAGGEGGQAGAKQYSPRAARAAQVARENGMIPASALQAKVEAEMARTAPQMAKPAEGEGARARGTLSSFGAPAKADDTGILGLPSGAGNGIIETASPPAFKTEGEVKAWIASPFCLKVLRQGRQRIHIPGTKEYEDNVAKYARRGEYGPSTLSITEDEAEALGLEYMGKGHLFIREKGWDGTETITEHNGTIGEVTNNLSGKTVKTSTFKIHYSKKGFHIVPDYPSRKGKEGD